jgi:hypothetical protein
MQKWVDEVIPWILPNGWVISGETDDGRSFVNRMRRLSVIVSGDTEQDGKRWIHFSVASPDRLPSWDTLVEMKELFLGQDRKAIQVIPPKSEHVNIHPNCLHLFVCVDNDPLPDFTRGEGLL